jgi:hypothetical protein
MAKLGVGFLLFYLFLILGAVVGWVLNFIAVSHSDFSHLTPLLVLRLLGIPFVIIGAVLGWFA